MMKTDGSSRNFKGNFVKDIRISAPLESPFGGKEGVCCLHKGISLCVS